MSRTKSEKSERFSVNPKKANGFLKKRKKPIMIITMIIIKIMVLKMRIKMKMSMVMVLRMIMLMRMIIVTVVYIVISTMQIPKKKYRVSRTKYSPCKTA